MRNEQTELSEKTELEERSAEARLFAEILDRMDHSEDTRESAGRPAETEKTIDLLELFYFILSKLHYIILGMVLGGMLMGFYATHRTVPVYTATSKLYIVGQTGANIITDLQIGSVLTMDYQEVFKTWEVHEMVNEALGLNYSYSQLQSMLSVENPEDTRVLYITIRNTDPQLAADIANAYASAAKQFITQTMDTDEPSMFSIALVPGMASGTGVTGYVIRGILLGTVLAGVILVLIFLLDNRPKSPEDIMQAANIPTLAVVPKSADYAVGKKHRKKVCRS